MMLMEERNTKERGGREEDQEMGDEIQCTNHPYGGGRNNPGGICPYCLREKLTNLLSSSSSSSLFPFAAATSSSSSSSPEIILSSSSSSSSLRRPRIPRKKKKIEKELDSHGAIALNRSKSTAIPIHGPFLLHNNGVDSGPRKRPGVNLWSVLHPNRNPRNSSAGIAPGCTDRDREVSRSRSVGCGSRSFSGCALRGGELSGKPKERVRCGGIFSGFNLNSASSTSSSSSSSYCVSSQDVNGRSYTSWVWALSSPMRGFTRHSSKQGNRGMT